MKEKTAFFAVARKFLESEMWLSEPFTKAQAWIDLIGRASFKDGDLTKRGELMISELSLAKRWKWDRSRVRGFLQRLEKDGMITRSIIRSNNPSGKRSKIHIEKYEVYQTSKSKDQSKSQSKERPLYNNIDNVIDNISLYMPDGMAESLKALFGDKYEALLEDVKRYYGSHPDKEFPGWEQAMAQFNANQVRWGRKDKKKKADSDDWFEGLEEELDQRGNW